MLHLCRIKSKLLSKLKKILYNRKNVIYLYHIKAKLSRFWND